MTRRYRRSAHVVCHWKGGGGVIYNYATARETQATGLLWQLLDCCDGWRSAHDVRLAVAPILGEAVIRRVLDAMVAATFVEASDLPRDPREERMDGWRAWNPAAGFYHSISRQVTYGAPALFARRLKIKAAHTPMPASIKPAAGRRVALPNVERAAAFTDVLRDRRTWRRFGKRPISRADLARVLRATSGITHWLTIPGLGEVPLTSSPSGGARHPIETYVAVLRVTSVSRGVYRYAPDRHELDVVRPGLSLNEVRRFIPRQPWVSGAAFILFFTAVFARTQWRYEFPRAYRAVLLETGHICQTFLLAATSLGLAPFSTMAIDDNRLEGVLGVDGVTEAVLYAAGAGTRPRYGGRVVMPKALSPPIVRPHRRRTATATPSGL